MEHKISERAFQLNFNKKNSMGYYFISKEREDELILFDVNNGNIYLKKTLLFKSEVVSSGWIKDSIIIQTKTSLFCFDTENDTLLTLPFLNDKINTILDFSQTSMVFSTRLLFETIEIKKVVFSTNEKELLAEINLLDNYSLQLYTPDYVEEINSLVRSFANTEDNIFDNYEGTLLKICSTHNLTNMFLDDKLVLTVEGVIDRAFLISKEKVIFSYSSFSIPQNVFVKNADNSISDCSGKKIELENHMRFKHLFVSNHKIPLYFIESYKPTDRYLIFLHGGPAANYTRNYNPLWVRACKEFNVILLNYTGSTGYGKEHLNKIRGKAGKLDLSDVLKTIEYIKEINQNAKIVLCGESYGGYLSILASLHEPSLLIAAISINGFTDIRYQYLFSISKRIINPLFDINNRNLEEINPIDIIQKTPVLSDLLLIHSIHDKHCPIGQIYQFSEISRKFNNKVTLQEIDNIDHYTINYGKMRHLEELALDFALQRTIINE